MIRMCARNYPLPWSWPLGAAARSGPVTALQFAVLSYKAHPSTLGLLGFLTHTRTLRAELACEAEDHKRARKAEAEARRLQRKRAARKC